MKKAILIISSLLLLNFIAIPTIKAQSEKGKVIELSEKDFDKTIKSGLYLVDFYADWCRPCKMMQPILNEVATSYSDKITIAKINTDKNKNLSKTYRITGIPCMIIFKDGKEISRIVGYNEKEALVKKIKPYFKN